MALIYVFVTKAGTIAHVNFQARAMEMILVWWKNGNRCFGQYRQ